jgi:hypothetical protein
MRHTTLLLVLTLVPVGAQAIGLTAGGSGAPVGKTTPAGEILLASISFPFTTPGSGGSGGTGGTGISAVYLNAGGTLDFTYQISNSAGSQGSISLADALSFGGSVTDVDYLTNGSALPGAAYPTDGTVIPLRAFRSTTGGGAVVGLNFGPQPASNIQPGQTSVVLFIRTNATLFTSGLIGLIAGGIANITAFQPVAPSPCITGLTGRGTASGRSPARIDLTWTGIVNTDHYTVLRGNTSGGPYAPLGNTTLPAYSDSSGLSNGATYFYVVQPATAAGTAICQSTQVQVKIPSTGR